MSSRPDKKLKEQIAEAVVPDDAIAIRIVAVPSSKYINVDVSTTDLDTAYDVLQAAARHVVKQRESEAYERGKSGKSRGPSADDVGCHVQ